MAHQEYRPGNCMTRNLRPCRKGVLMLLIVAAGIMLTSCRSTNAPEDHSTYFLLEDSTLDIDAKQAWQFFLDGRFRPQSSHSFNP
jgi:hypothetical protein